MVKKRILDQSVFGVSEVTEANSKLFKFLEHKDPSQYDKIMDHVYNETHIGGGWHRSFDESHTFAGSYEKIKAATGDVEFVEFAKSHFNELVTPQGIPLLNLPHKEFFQMTNEVSDCLGGFVSAGQLRSYLVDFNSVNAGEAVSAGLGCIFLMFAIKSGEPKAISRVTALNLCLGLATGNPVQILTGVSGLAYGVWNGKISAWDMLVGATPAIAGFAVAELATMSGAGKIGGPFAGILAAVGTAALIGHLEKENQKKLTGELGNNKYYLGSMTPWVLQKEIEIMGRSRNSLAIPL